MARILSIDYGKKRTGIAVTDPMQIIATGFTTIDSHELIPFLKKYFETETVELIIIGMPLNLDDSDTQGTEPAKKAIERIKKGMSSWESIVVRPVAIICIGSVTAMPVRFFP